MTISEAVRQVFHYHETTKHQAQRPAKSLGYMDWTNQPNPFRLFKNSPVLRLPFIEKDSKASHQCLFTREHSTPQPYSLEVVAAIAELSLALSAWKEAQGSNGLCGSILPAEICGFQDNSFQSLYHFTVGYPVDDSRISTRSPYFHLVDADD
ncbi:MAG: hypothetical protein HN580_04435 [Deltaproteobacteria bacterium]|jgi:hypothetical protein|nr:hypothetical protein [Deltaproteobacteria bacterium]MBT4265820.1 hypothetical protein [Deltaproteobacteria bacterium]MBT4638726.1 hypothetical protein [Deltaproteobacteria bacterium]MBT6503060.1 hypothetical protein [Deltaproteobacteria bacterium]MBT6614359.1 hypothetical protein [Deltaproteobacteria bacterium]